MDLLSVPYLVSKALNSEPRRPTADLKILLQAEFTAAAGNMFSSSNCLRALVLVLAIGAFSVCEGAAFVGMGKVRVLCFRCLPLRLAGVLSCILLPDLPVVLPWHIWTSRAFQRNLQGPGLAVDRLPLSQEL